MIRWATQSRWSHVAIAFWMIEIDRVLVLECVKRMGVRAVPLSDFTSRTSSGIHPYPGRILLARHQDVPFNAGQSTMREMSKFAFNRLGAKFSNLETAKIVLRILLGRFDRKMPAPLAADDEYICSEYVAKCYEHIGLPITWDGVGVYRARRYRDRSPNCRHRADSDGRGSDERSRLTGLRAAFTVLAGHRERKRSANGQIRRQFDLHAPPSIAYHLISGREALTELDPKRE